MARRAKTKAKMKVEATEESILDYHLRVLNDELVDEDGQPMKQGDTAKTQSSRAVRDILQARDDRERNYLPRKDVQTVLAALAGLVRDRLLQAATQGVMERDTAEAILIELSGESTRLFAQMVDDE